MKVNNTETKSNIYLSTTVMWDDFRLTNIHEIDPSIVVIEELNYLHNVFPTLVKAHNLKE